MEKRCPAVAILILHIELTFADRHVSSITKIEAARRNLAVAIRMFFDRGDPVAVHTLAAAAQGVIRDIAKARGAAHTSILHDNPDIPPDRRKEWIRILNTPRNFFKHADADPNGPLEFDAAANETLLLDTVLTLAEVNHTPLSEANVYIGWFTTANPELRGAINNNQIGDYAVRNQIASTDFDQFRELIDAKILIDPHQGMT